MRNALITLLGFVAGVLLTLAWPGQLISLPHSDPSTPVAATSVAATGEMTVANVGRRWPSTAPTPEQILYGQPRMMHDALANLGPRVAGKPNLYLLTFAGDGGEDVFRNEAEYAARLFKQRFGTSVHSLVLANNPATLTIHPLASWSNLETALAGIHQAMQPEQDILLVYVSTHGSEDHELLVDMDPLPLDQINATDLADILALHPFKWKVVVVNACYSGGFVPPLRGAGTLVLTAARSDRSSFGCGSDSDITYFGKAWLVDALNHTDNFVDAFEQARHNITAWETQDDLTPSEPQIDIGSGIQHQLTLWRQGIPPGPTVPFVPTAPPRPNPASPH